jgi:nitrogen regulatory protein P-II 1
MLLVTAIVKPFAFAEVRAALARIGVASTTVSEVTGFGRQRGHTEVYRGADYRIDYVPKLRIEVIVDEGRVDEVVETVVAAARSGRIGDGKVWVSPLGAAIDTASEEAGAPVHEGPVRAGPGSAVASWGARYR